MEKWREKKRREHKHDKHKCRPFLCIQLSAKTLQRNNAREIEKKKMKKNATAECEQRE